MQYYNLPSKTTGHRPLEAKLKVLQVPPTPSDNVDQDAQPSISPADEHDTSRWMAYRSLNGILGHQTVPDLNLAVRQAAAACSLCERIHHKQETAILHRNLRSMVSAIWCEKRDPHTAIHSQEPHTQRSAHRIAARLENTRRQLQEWFEHRAKDLSQEQQRYL